MKKNIFKFSKMQYDTCYKVSSGGRVFTSNLAISEDELLSLPEKYKGKKLEWATVGYCYISRDKKTIIPYWQARGINPPCFEDGTIAEFENYDVRKLNWDTVEWDNPRYPWEGPSLNSRFWKRQDGQWVNTNGWWEIHYSDGTKFIPMWNHKQKRLLEKGLPIETGIPFEELLP